MYRFYNHEIPDYLNPILFKYILCIGFTGTRALTVSKGDTFKYILCIGFTKGKFIGYYAKK